MILCCGEALIDCLPRKGADGADVFQPVNGGSIYNTAIALGRLGEKVGLFAGISKDFFGDSLRAGLAASHVSPKYLRLKDNHTTLALVKLVDGHARYSFIDDASAGRNLVKADLPKLPKAVTALHFGSISLIPEPCATTYETLLKQASKSRVISLDPNIRPTLIKDKAGHVKRLTRLIALADVLKISDEDVQWMTGSKNLEKAARAWLKKGAKIVAITRGGEGCSVFTRRFAFEALAPKVKVADTVGAGDTFTAGLLHYFHSHGLLSKKALAAISDEDLKAAAFYAMKAAAVTVSRPGADPPWAKEMA
ncbi:MAG: carbohydrate kinase [Alphaproteobacteria bacterium]|nr:carbohydrate kinase [Alphaproteobacteria bacterium]